jgi:uncharacterized repeat protein (TIGR01451 family)
MSPDPHFPRILSPDRLQQYRCLLTSTLLISSQSWLWLCPAIAVPNAGTVIENQATGSYQNDISETQTTQSIVSDTVTLTVAEVAGINVISAGVSEAATTVTNAGIYQGNGTINVGDIVYYDYLITNVGNDPTQFFIPDSPSSVSGGTFDSTNNPIQVIAYNLTGTSTVLTTPVTIPTGGKRTGPDTATGTTGGLLGKNGIIPPSGSVTIRVPIKINTTATAGQSVSVIMGNTSPNDNTAATQNQVYLNNNNQDIYTQDNPDGTTNTANVVIETTGDPINGDSTSNGNITNYHRQEASATSQATVVLPLQGFKSVKLTVDADNSATISAGDTLTWTLSYVNNGSTSITNFQITDLLPPNVTMTNTGAQTIAINTIQGSTPPVKNAGYTGLGISGASINNLLNNSITLVPGGVITVSIPVKVNAGTPATTILSNQSIATGSGLMAAGVKTDNVDRTTTNLPTDVIVPVDSVLQTQNNTIDPTTATVLGTWAYIVSPDRDKIIINEVLYKQTDATDATTNDEFIELYNSSSTTVDLTGWKLIDGNIIEPNNIESGPTGTISGSSTVPFIFGTSFPVGVTTSGNPVLQPGQYAVIWVGTSTPSKQAAGATFQAWLGQRVKLSDTGDDVWLYDSQTRIVDYVAFGTGTSINKRPPTTFLNNTFWDSTYEAHSTLKTGQSISLTPNGQNPATGHISGCWEPTTSGASASSAARCPGALPTRDTDPFATTTLIQRITSVGVSNNGVTTSPNVLLVKRITAINGLPQKTSGESITGYEHFNTYDDNVITIPTQLTITDPPRDTDKWPNAATGFLLGTTNGGKVKPNDSIEYTIYFLSTGTSDAKNVLFCDRVPANVTFIPNAFNNVVPAITPDTSGLSGANRGIVVNIGDTIKSYTSVADGDDAQYFPPNVEPSTVYGTKINCGGANNNGAVVFNLKNLKSATGTLATDKANGAYGFVRFRGLVK